MKSSFKLLLIQTSLISISFFSCENPRRPIYNKTIIDYNSETVLDSLIGVTQSSTDTIFLGFNINMSKSDFKNRIAALRNEGKKITYSTSNVFSTSIGKFDAGSGYTFHSPISIQQGDRLIKGEGSYFLEPIYNSNGNLTSLTILPIEEWNEEPLYTKPEWLKKKITESSKAFANDDLKKALTDYDILKTNGFLRAKNNTIISESVFSITYYDLRTIYTKLLEEKLERERINDQNKEIKF